MAFGWTGATTAFASVVRKPKNSRSPSPGFAFVPRVPRQVVQRPANTKIGNPSPRPNHVDVFRCFVFAHTQE